MYRTNGLTNPGNDHITSRYIRHHHANGGLRDVAVVVVVVGHHIQQIGRQSCLWSVGQGKNECTESDDGIPRRDVVISRMI